MKYPIFLIGYMSSGKSSIGKKLAKALNVDYFDLDKWIEEAEGISISEIFHKKGAESFRKIEAIALRLVEKNQKAIIALGGGTPCYHENMNYIKETGTSIFLNISEGTLIGRLREKKAKRPLVADLNDNELSLFVKNQLKERKRYYQDADFQISSETKPKIEEILKVLSLESST